MGDAQSAQRERNEDAEAEEESAKVDDAPAEHNTGDIKPLRISEINGKADSTTAEANGRCEEETTAEDKDVSGTAKQTKDEETALESIDINEKESLTEANADHEEDEPMEIIEMDAKQNDLNDSFRRFFSNISLKLSVKRGSVDKDQIATDESNTPEDVKETVKEADHDEQSIDLNAQGTYDNDSTTCPTLTDVTSEDIPENTQEKTAETKEESDNVDTATASPVAEDETVQRDAMFEAEDLNPASTSSPEPEEVASPVKRFFTSGIFSGLRKKKTSIEDETIERELVEMGKGTTQAKEKREDVQQDNETSPPATVETENIDHTEENLMVDEGESPPVTTIYPENTASHDKVQDSPLKWLLSGSSFRKTSKKQRSRKSSYEKLSESGEHSDLLKTPKQESRTQQSAETAAEEDGAWASFKKLLTPKKHTKRSSLTNEEAQVALGERKPSEGEQMSDNSAEEGKKRKDSSVSWDAVLCGSGKKSRSRKTSDSEEETPQTEDRKETTPRESSSEADETANSPKQAGSPSEGEGGSTWKSFKKLVTPKRKSKDEEEIKDSIQSDSEAAQDESSFSIKKFLPGRKKKKSAENQDQVSSDEADKEVVSGDEDSDTPAVVPLSEFDTPETEVHIATQADVESPVPTKEDHDLEQDLLDQTAKPVVPSDSLQTDTKKIQANGDNVKNEPPAAAHEEAEDLTESFSPHHQLSDIPEEGIITDTIATQASIAEEAARDDTIMEDLIEITSEAITAPEPIDETEMISAVSQLSESSNTSGNITPVPVEYDFRQTEALLQQVVETISISPEEAEPVCSEEIDSERIRETFVKRESAILETHMGSDAVSIVTSLNAEGTDIIEHSATAHMESISEINELVSEEFVTAEIAVDEVHEVGVSHKPLVERQCDVNEAASMETLPEVESIVADEGCLVGTRQDKKEPLEIEMDSQEAESAAIIAEESEDQTPTHKEEQILPHITEADNKDQPEKEVEQLQAIQAVQDGSEEGTDQLLEKEVLSEDCPAEGTVADEPKEKTVALTEYNVGAKTEKVQADAAQPDHSEEPDVLEDVQTATIHLDVGSVQLLEKEATTEETVTGEPNEASEFLTQYADEEMEDKMQVHAAKSEHFEENVLEAAQTTKDSKEDSSQLLKYEVTVEDTTAEEVTDKPEEETEPIVELDVKAEMENQIRGDGVQIVQTLAEYDAETENKTTDEHAEELQVLEVVQTLNLENVSGQLLQTDAAQPEQVLEAVQTATLDLEDNSDQLLAEKVISDDTAAGESITDKSNEDTQPPTEYDIAVDTENRLQEDAAQTQNTTEADVVKAVQTATLNLEKDGSGQFLEKEVLLEDIQAQETVTNKPKTQYDVKEETEHRLQTDAAHSTQVGQPEELEAVRRATLDFVEDIVISEDIPAEETVTDKAKEKTEPLTEYNIAAEAETKLQIEAAQTEHTGEPEVLEAVERDTVEFEEDSGQLLPKEIILEETVTDKAKEEIEPLSEYNVAADAENKLQKDAAQTEQTGQPEVLAAVETETLVIEEGNLQTSNESEEPQTVPAPEMFANETEQATEDLSDVSSKPDDKDLERDASNIDQEVLSENNEAKAKETEPLTEGSELVVAIDSEHLQDHEVAKDVIVAAEDVTGHIQQPEVSPSNVNDTEAEVESSKAAETVTESTEGGSVDVLKVNEDEKTESTPQDAQVSEDDHVHEDVDEVQTVTTVCVLSVDDDDSDVTPAAFLENALFTQEKTHSNVEEEKVVIPGFEVKHAAVEHATVAQVTACHLKDVAAATPDAMIETKSDSREALIESVVSQLDVKETTEAALVKEDVREEESSVVVMNVPLVEFKDSCQIQVQVESAEKTVDTALEVGITEVKEVIDVCCNSVKDVDKSETEEALVHEENMVIIQEVTQHVESVLVVLEEKVVKQTDAETEFSEVEDQNVVEDTTVGEDVAAVPGDESATEEQTFKDLVQTPDIQGELDLGDEEEPKTVTTDDLKKINKETTITQIVIPQNTGIISSIGNVETPSSLSLEFKLNIQLGPPTTERTEPMKKTEVSEVGVQAVEPEEEPEKKEKKTELVDVTETEPADVEQTNQPQLLDVGMQTVTETTESRTANVQVSETTETIIKEKTEVSLSQEGPADVCELLEPVKQAEEAEQDVWMDAEEDVDDNLEETETDEPPERQRESSQEETSAAEPDFDTAAKSRVEEEENQQTLKPRGTFEKECEGEDFTDSAAATASTAITEWD